ncbi:serine carboxypeptidase-like 26 [Olea europaea subsp. europaea]|uniref:Serine carboxypeptidase-like 26 n=1 Tax=Olea europaea subsp. europaea TaxID=158383 RepID=A0A8S0TGR4_OLEEU|nr:serine carboxypeptidase-like 26 [Olea europaea subsp. europaea]
MLIYIFVSGDVDAVVPVTGTRYSIGAMNLKVIKPWRPWLDETDEFVALVIRFHNFSPRELSLY